MFTEYLFSQELGKIVFKTLILRLNLSFNKSFFQNFEILSKATWTKIVPTTDIQHIEMIFRRMV